MSGAGGGRRLASERELDLTTDIQHSFLHVADTLADPAHYGADDPARRVSLVAACEAAYYDNKVLYGEQQKAGLLIDSELDLSLRNEEKKTDIHFDNSDSRLKWLRLYSTVAAQSCELILQSYKRVYDPTLPPLEQHAGKPPIQVVEELGQSLVAVANARANLMRHVLAEYAATVAIVPHNK
jgi:hypothetical protein